MTISAIQGLLISVVMVHSVLEICNMTLLHVGVRILFLKAISREPLRELVDGAQIQKQLTILISNCSHLQSQTLISVLSFSHLVPAKRRLQISSVACKSVNDKRMMN